MDPNHDQQVFRSLLNTHDRFQVTEYIYVKYEERIEEAHHHWNRQFGGQHVIQFVTNLNQRSCDTQSFIISTIY
jgi:hypothetical protein